MRRIFVSNQPLIQLWNSSNYFLLVNLVFFLPQGLSANKATSVSQQFEANLSSLSRGALGQTLMVNQLVDIEWKFGGQFLHRRLDYLWRSWPYSLYVPFISDFNLCTISVPDIMIKIWITFIRETKLKNCFYFFPPLLFSPWMVHNPTLEAYKSLTFLRPSPWASHV